MEKPDQHNENLNLDYNIKLLVVKALNRHLLNQQEAAKNLGTSLRNLHLLKHKYNIVFVNGKWIEIIKQPKHLLNDHAGRNIEFNSPRINMEGAICVGDVERKGK